MDVIRTDDRLGIKFMQEAIVDCSVCRRLACMKACLGKMVAMRSWKRRRRLGVG